MKKYIYGSLAVLGILLMPKHSFAAVTFSPSSTVVSGDECSLTLNDTMDSDYNFWYLFNNSGIGQNTVSSSVYSDSDIPYCETNMPTGLAPGNYTVLVGFGGTASENDPYCLASSTLSDCESNFSGKDGSDYGYMTVVESGGGSGSSTYQNTTFYANNTCETVNGTSTECDLTNAEVEVLYYLEYLFDLIIICTTAWFITKVMTWRNWVSEIFKK